MSFHIDDDLDDYIDVAARIAAVRGEAARVYPEGCFQPADLARPYTIETIEDRTFVVVVAAFYRVPEDTRPGIGMAWQAFPGTNQYTKDAELMNAETSAWGRALVAVLAADTRRGIASAQEVRAGGGGLELTPATVARIVLTDALAQRDIAPDAAADLFREQGHGELGQSDDVAAIRALIAHYRAVAA